MDRFERRTFRKDAAVGALAFTMGDVEVLPATRETSRQKGWFGRGRHGEPDVSIRVRMLRTPECMQAHRGSVAA
jgi:hypothetical protein